MSNFSLEHANNLPIDQCKEYITKYFYPLTTSQHIMISYDQDGKVVYEIKEDQAVKKVYFNRLPKDVNDFYFKKYDKIKTLTCELNKPMLFDNYFNTCPSFLHQVKPYKDKPLGCSGINDLSCESFSSAIKSKVNQMLDYLKIVWASRNQDQYEFILKWFANMARGGKNQSVLYLRSEEGVGKSTFTDFMMKYVIGSKLSLMSGSGPLLSNFNIILYCKLFVVYEELENFSTSQWQVVSSRIKRDITSTTCTYEKKNETSFVGKNINNVIINSNVDAIKNDEGRRYFILDLSNEKKGDVKFWDKIYECMNEEVGEAFFSYLHTIDLTDYHDQAFPSTNAKQDAIVKRLDTVARFIKEKYILRHRDLITTLQKLYDEYKNYCMGAGLRTECKIEFNTKLARYKLESKKSGNDHNKFNYKLEYLKEIAQFNKWMHITDQYELTEDLFDDLDNGIQDNKDDKDEEINLLKAQLEAMKKQQQIELDALNKQLNGYKDANTKYKEKLQEYDYLPQAYEIVKEDINKCREDRNEYYIKWFNTLSPEMKKEEEKRSYDQEANESVNRPQRFNYVLEYEKQQQMKRKMRIKKMEETRRKEEEKLKDLDPFMDDEDDEIDLEVMRNKIKELEAPRVIVVEKIDPIKSFIEELLEEQKEVNKLVASKLVASKKKLPAPMKKKIDPKIFELFLNDLDDLCN